MVNDQTRYQLEVIIKDAPNHVLIALRSLKWQPAGGARIQGVPPELQMAFFDEVIAEMTRRGLPMPEQVRKGRPIPTGPLRIK